MLELQDFISRSNVAHNAADIFDLPPPAPLAPVKIDYDLFPTGKRRILSGSFHQLFDSKDGMFCIWDRAFEVASPMTHEILAREAAAGVDLEGRNYEIEYRRAMVTAIPQPYAWHVDFRLPEIWGDPKNTVVINDYRKYLSSDGFCTAVASLYDLHDHKPDNLDWDDFGRMVCNASDDLENSLKRKILSVALGRGIENPDQLHEQLKIAICGMRANYWMADPHEIQCVTGAMPHALNFRIEPEPVRGIERHERNILMFESKPL